MGRWALIAVLLGFGLTGTQAAEGLPPEEAAPRRGEFQAYIFWAYGLACLLIFLFTLWTLAETRKVGHKIEYLKERFRRAHPEALSEEPDS